ncbi:FAD-dependent oxidoreductase [Candidatus Bipolaricaulota bacterium]|nr:FAD-dependent oxidoreductase [Candidatus Bipolaricaulota bacterium]
MRITINGKEMEGHAGEMILDVARRENIDIPALCAEERLEPFDSCGVCVVEVEGKGIVKSCSTPIEEDMSILTKSPEAETVRKAALELLLSNHWGDCVAPCQTACPAQTDCQAYVSLTANGRFLDGLKVLYKNLPLPASLGRICPAPCEDACRREIAEEPVQIRHMKRFLADHGYEYVPPVGEPSGKRVAIVGGGPAGLSAAFFLRQHGHDATVYDAMPAMGGMLRYGIPEYRLPQTVIDKELDVLRRMGITFRNGVRIGTDISCTQLENDFDAVFLGLGAWGTRGMGLPGEDHSAVIQGTDFLRRVSEGEQPTLPGHVVIIGGGNTAMDAARCARRLGAEVTVAYRRTAEQMPALRHEVVEAEDEGVVFKYLTQPIEFLADGEALRGIRCVEMELGEPDASGRRRPVPIEGSEFVIDAQAALLAVGQTIDTACLQESKIDLARNGAIIVSEATGRTVRDKVFAGGDVVTGPAIAVDAIGAGHRAADAIDCFLRGEAIEPPAVYSHVKYGVTRDDIGNPATSPRIRTAARDATERINDFAEYESGLSDEEAVTAAQRCLECGCMVFNDCALRDYATDAGAVQAMYEGEMPRKKRDERHPFIIRKVGKCIACGRCVRICSDVCGLSAIDFAGRGIDTEVQVPFNRAWQDSNCVSCGACVDVCPTGALYDRTVLEKQVPLELEGTKSVCVLCGLGCEVEIQSLDGAYMRTTPADGSSVLCARGRYGWHTLGDAKRITTPMIRSGSALREASWSEALHEAGKRLREAQGNVAAFGTGLLTCEEGWLVSRIADGLGAGAPVFDVSVLRPQTEIADARILPIEGLSHADLIVMVGPRGSYEKVALDSLLLREMARGARVISYGADVPHAIAERDVSEFGEFLSSLREGESMLEESLTRAKHPIFLFEEAHIARARLEQVAAFMAQDDVWSLVFVPATANAIGLRRLGFSEQLRTNAKAWLTVGADPAAMASGRQYLPQVNTLVALSPVRSATTHRADVVFPMGLPYETRGHIISASGPRVLVPGARGPVESETWEILLKLAGELKVGPLPWHFDALSEAAKCEDLRGIGGLTAAGATPSSITTNIDARLNSLGI